MRRVIVALASVVLALPWPGPAAAQAPCQFVLGFAALRALIPVQVGQCLENQQTNVENGDAFQRTSGGLLVWRKLDNWTAFTDGFRTWLNGPNGLQQRLNTERYAWEGDAGAPGTTLIAPALPPAAAAAPPPPPPAAAAPPPPPAGFDPRRYVTSGDAYNCGDFASQAQAQAVLRAAPSDPNRLDADRDGIACENNPPPRDLVRVPR